MKLFALVLLFILILTLKVDAVEISTSVPSDSQYLTGRSYGFQIKVDDIPGVTNVIFEWNSTSNYTASNVADDYFYNLTDLAAGSYSYRWYVDNTTSIVVVNGVYSVLKNSSVPIVLMLNDAQDNKSYELNDIANFTVFLNIPGKTVYLISDYPGLYAENANSRIEYLTSITSSGYFNLTAYWNGDQNYTASSRTYFFEDQRPQYSNEITEPPNSASYSPNGYYYFGISWSGPSLTEVGFESNFSGSFKNYTSKTDTRVYNESGNFWINISSQRARGFVYRWYAKDGVDRATSSEQKTYIIFEGFALTLIGPYANVTNGTTTVVSCSSNDPKVEMDDFELYRNSTLIENLSISSRGDIAILPVGLHIYSCNFDGNQNYTNQSLKYVLRVFSADGEEEVEEVVKELKISDVSSPEVVAGQAGTGTFNLTSTLDETINEIGISLINIDSSWYTIENVPSALLTGGSVIINIVFNIPSDAELKDYDITIRAVGEVDSGTRIETADMTLTVTDVEPIQNQAPSFSNYVVNISVPGEPVVFSLEINDDQGLSGFIFSTNITGSWQNDSWVQLTGTQDNIEVLKNISSATGLAIGWKVYVNDTDNLWTIFENHVLKTGSGEFDYTIPILIVVVVVIIIITLIILQRRGTSIEDVVYVYQREGYY